MRYGLRGRQQCQLGPEPAGKGEWVGSPGGRQALAQPRSPCLAAVVQGQEACPETTLFRDTGPPSLGPWSPGPVPQTTAERGHGGLAW